MSEELEDRLRVTALKQKGTIVKFVVQYEALIENKWRAIIRYDNSHGFAHKDIIHYNGEQEKQPLYFPDLNIAFTFAIQDLKILGGGTEWLTKRRWKNEERFSY